MRALINRMFPQADSNRHYQVSANIVFHFVGFEPTGAEIEALQEAILRTDAEQPWREEPNAITHEVPKSIDFIHPTVVRHNWGTVEFCVWFEIRPEVTCLRSSQVAAYEKYVVELAKRVAEHKTIFVSDEPIIFGKVHTVVTTNRVTYLTN